jgi:AcrR family transcriptional regulator
VPSVKGSRPYSSSLRAEQARTTRAAVLDAARELFVDRGYVATTIEDIARRAGVSRPTVFAAVGSKATLLSLLRDQALAGDDEPVPVTDRPWFRELLDEPDAGHTVELHARNVTMMNGRYAMLEEVLHAAAGADPAMRELWETSERERLAGARVVAENLAGKSPWRQGIDSQSASQLLWTLTAADVFRRLVHSASWPPARYETWLAATLRSQLLPTDRSPS